MKFIILLLCLNISAWGASLTTEFKSAPLQKFAAKARLALGSVDLAPNKKIYKLNLVRGIDTSTQIQDLFYSYYLDGTEVMAAKTWSKAALTEQVRKLYYYPEAPDAQAKQSLAALVNLLETKLASYENLKLLASEPALGDFGTMAGIILKDQDTSEAFVLLTGFSE